MGSDHGAQRAIGRPWRSSSRTEFPVCPVGFLVERQNVQGVPESSPAPCDCVLGHGRSTRKPLAAKADLPQSIVLKMSQHLVVGSLLGFRLLEGQDQASIKPG